MRKLYFILILLICGIAWTVNIQAQGLQAFFQKSTFYSPTEGPFIETYLKVFGNTVNFVENENGKYQAKIGITIIFKKSGEIFNFRKYDLLSPEIEDSSKLKADFLDQQRISIPNGIYNIELTIVDINSTIDPMLHTDIVRVDYEDKKSGFSSIQLVERYEKSSQKNILTKSGFDLYPLVNYFYPIDLIDLNFYAELYNIDKDLGPNVDFLITGYIEASDTERKLADYAINQRQKSNIVNVILGNFNINQLPSGNYNLVVEARDRENNLLKTQKVFFFRSNPGIEMNLEDVPTIDVSESFVSQITSIDTMSYFLASLRPIGNTSEKRFIDNQLKSGDITIMKQFFLSFWQQRNEINPEMEWKTYYEAVKFTENNYSTRIKRGFETDRGRVYLQYGTPDNIEGIDHEPEAYPYTIWQYFRIGDNQNDVRFLFYNPNLVGTEYIILHSDARGEISNPNWESYLYGRSGGVGGIGSRAKELFIK